MFRYLFIINPISGTRKSRDQLVRQIESTFKNTSAGYEIRYTQYAGHATRLAGQAAENNIDLVVAIGGDGTINEVGRGLVGTESALGIIPRGSGNGFARSLGIPLGCDQALSALCNPDFIQVDVGRLNSDYFFGVAGVGFDALIGYKFQQFGTRGPLPYFYTGLREYFSYEYEAFTISSAGVDQTISPLLITIANTSQYGNGAVIAPQADFRDGLLDVCIIDRVSALVAASKLINLFNGKINTLPYYTSFKTDRLVVRRQKDRGIYHTDGEPHQGGRELVFSVEPGKLKVAVPAGVYKGGKKN